VDHSGNCSTTILSVPPSDQTAPEGKPDADVGICVTTNRLQCIAFSRTAVIPVPAIMAAINPLVSFPVPPKIALETPSAMFSYPPATVALSLLAVFLYPPPTVERLPLAVFPDPPPTAE
jgi:hypothetical protein